MILKNGNVRLFDAGIKKKEDRKIVDRNRRETLIAPQSVSIKKQRPYTNLMKFIN